MIPPKEKLLYTKEFLFQYYKCEKFKLQKVFIKLGGKRCVLLKKVRQYGKAIESYRDKGCLRLHNLK